MIKDQTNATFSFPTKIVNHKNLNNLVIKNIQLEKEFYNVKMSHVSEATFYRLYLSNLFTEEDFNIIYLDADIICVNNPINEIASTFDNMDSDSEFLGFADELKKIDYSEPFHRLEMKNDKYFNAGVMLLNLGKWKENNYTQKSLDLVERLKNKAKFWDQDILNSLIDGKYFTISNNLYYILLNHIIFTFSSHSVTEALNFVPSCFTEFSISINLLVVDVTFAVRSSSCNCLEQISSSNLITFSPLYSIILLSFMIIPI